MLPPEQRQRSAEPWSPSTSAGLSRNDCGLCPKRSGSTESAADLTGGVGKDFFLKDSLSSIVKIAFFYISIK